MSTQSGTYFLGTFGFPIAINTGADLTGATACNLELVKPDGALVSRDLTPGAITNPTGGIVTYLPLETEVNQAGVYTFSIKVPIASDKQAVGNGQFAITPDLSATDDFLVVETGEGLDDANSYATVADGDAYHAAHLYPADWINATPSTKQKALVMATRLIDTNYDFKGYRSHETQALMWPRMYVPNRDDFYGTLVISLWRSSYMSGTYYASDAIPGRIKEATCELAREMIKADRTLEYEAKGISSIGLGQGAVSVSFGADTSDRTQILPDLVKTMLQPFGQSRVGRTSANVYH